MYWRGSARRWRSYRSTDRGPGRCREPVGYSGPCAGSGSPFSATASVRTARPSPRPGSGVFHSAIVGGRTSFSVAGRSPWNRSGVTTCRRFAPHVDSITSSAYSSHLPRPRSIHRGRSGFRQKAVSLAHVGRTCALPDRTLPGKRRSITHSFRTRSWLVDAVSADDVTRPRATAPDRPARRFRWPSPASGRATPSPSAADPLRSRSAGSGRAAQCTAFPAC